MTKIGVLTFHNNDNRGAILQAYSTCRLLESLFNANVEVVEYRTRSKEASRKRSLVVTKRPWTIPDRIRDRIVVENFLESELPTSEQSIITDDYEAAVAWLQEQNYDVLVTGSDEVWKIKEEENTGIRSFVSPSRPFPNLYFLDESLPGTKFSYASSANKLNRNMLSSVTVEKVRRKLAAYDHVSVRDLHTKKLVEEFGVDKATQVPDPTLMIDLPTRDVESILSERGIDLNQPILNFHGSIHPVFEQICDEYRDRGYQIVTTRASPYADIELRGVVDPFEYYSLYKHFDMVVTDSLHSSIFSIKHKIPFITIDTNPVYEKIESKTHSLLQDFSMLDRHIYATDGDDSKFYKNQHELEGKPDAKHIKNRTEELQEQGFEFLNRIKQSL